MTTTLTPYTLAEVRSAAQALKAGRFRAGVGGDWTPREDESPVLVIGCCAGVGATTMAVALASAAGRARVIECAAQERSGLVAAGYSELGERDGWLLSERDGVRLERRADLDPFAIPTPLQGEQADATLLIDAGSCIARITQTPWLRSVMSTAPTVLVTQATIPGLRRLEATLAALQADDSAEPAAAVVVGPPRKRWRKELVYELGRLTRDLDTDRALFTVPLDSQLTYRGLDAHPLPDEVQHVGDDVIRFLQLPTVPRK